MSEAKHMDPLADIPTAAELREQSRNRIAELERELATEKARADHNFKNARKYASEIQTLTFQRRVFETAAQEAFSQRDDLLAACEAALKYIPGSEVRNWPPGFQLRDDALRLLRTAITKAKGTQSC